MAAPFYKEISFRGLVSNKSLVGEGPRRLADIAINDEAVIGTIASNLQQYAASALGGLRANPEQIFQDPTGITTLAVSHATALQALVGNPADPSGLTYAECLYGICADPAFTANSSGRIAEIVSAYGARLLNP